MYENQLTGSIPSSLGNLDRVWQLNLGQNRLTGSIPPELADMDDLVSIFLRGNQLTGCIPAGLRDIPENDFGPLGLDLPFCGSQTPIPNATTTPGAQPPTAKAGPDQYVRSGDLVTLDGSGSSTDATYYWRMRYTADSSSCQSQCPAPADIYDALGDVGDAVTLSDPSSLTPTFTAPSGGILTAFEIQFELTVTRDGLSAKDCMNVVVNAGPEVGTSTCQYLSDTPTATSTDQDADSYYDSGIAHHENGDYDRAIADFSKAIELDPNRAEFYHARGGTYLQKDDYDRAIADFSKAIELDPNRAGAYHDRGWTYLLKDDYARAIADFSKAIELEPQGAWHYFQRGVSYRSRDTDGDLDRAIADYNKAIELDPSEEDFRQELAYAYEARGDDFRDTDGDYDRAIADYTKGIELGSSITAELYHDRGWTYLLKDDYDRAIADFTKAIELEPQNAWHYFQRGVSYQSRDAAGDLDRAIADYEKAIELDPTEEDFRQALADAQEARGDDVEQG